MKRYQLMAKSAGQYAPKFSIGVFLAVVAMIGWQLLGLDGQFFVGVMLQALLLYFVLPGIVVACVIGVIALVYATYRDWKRGIL